MAWRAPPGHADVRPVPGSVIQPGLSGVHRTDWRHATEIQQTLATVKAVGSSSRGRKHNSEN